MTLAVAELAMYAATLLVLFLTPVPVWVALSARALAEGFHAAWPLAVGAAVAGHSRHHLDKLVFF
ncbi:MAG: hypothetical protein AB8B63_19930 [Granulosicoccus sp.]